MKWMMFSIFDRASGAYDRPFVQRSENEAMRSFGDICMDDKHPIGQHPEDYTLYHVGIWNDNTAVIEPGDATKVMNGAEAVSFFEKAKAEGKLDA